MDELQIHLRSQNEKNKISSSAQIYSNMSYLKKWEQAFSLREMAWALKKARIKTLNPHWTEDEVQTEVKRIFLYART